MSLIINLILTSVTKKKIVFALFSFFFCVFFLKKTHAEHAGLSVRGYPQPHVMSTTPVEKAKTKHHQKTLLPT